MTYTVATCPTTEGKNAAVFSAALAITNTIVTDIPDGSVGVLIDDDYTITSQVSVYNRLRDMRDLLNNESLNVQADGVSVAYNSIVSKTKIDIIRAAIADNTVSALSVALGTGNICIVASGAMGGTEVAYSAAIRCIDTLLEKLLSK